MLFPEIPLLPLLQCPICHSTGVVEWQRCRSCHGLAMGRFTRGHWLYWSYPLTRYHLALERMRRIFNKIRFLFVLLLGINFWLWAVWLAYRRGFFQNIILLFNDHSPAISYHGFSSWLLLFWFGVICFCYGMYRSIREKATHTLVEHFDYKMSTAEGMADEKNQPSDWRAVFRMSRAARHNIATSFTNEALTVLGAAYHIADRARATAFLPLHLAVALVSSNRISNIFIRLGIPSRTIKDELIARLKDVPGESQEAPEVSPQVQHVLFAAYEEAYRAHQEYVSVTELLVAVLSVAPAFQEILYDVGVDKQKLVNVVEWARIRERLYRQYQHFRQVASHRSKYGIDKAMTAVATPYLNQFSDDVTLLAQFGRTETCVAREREIEQIFQVVEGGQENVILVGDYGVGKRSVVEGLAERMVADDVPRRLQDKRMVRLSVSSLLSGTTPAGAVERLIHIMTEIARARNIILFIHNVHELIGVSAGNEGQSLDVASTLAEYLSGGQFMTIATTSTEAYSQHISNSKLSALFSKVEIPEMDENQAIQVLESKVGYVEYKQRVFFSYDALEKAVQLSRRFLHDVTLPGSALEVMSEAASFSHNQKGEHSLVTGEEVAAVIGQKTKIPVTTVTADETTKLMHLEETMHQRVIGQDEAVNLVANALRRARAQIRSTNRPIANFLFLGPTGVGKTELAKTIAEVYFGGEERMVRLDMSEYQDKASIYRLIGKPGERGSGVLTEAIRRSPFALLLLDEIEKADKDILNLFLQVMDDGRLSDSTGRVVDFTNVILIATSNAGTSYVQEQLRAGLSTDMIKDRLLHGQLKEYFRPEFLNRFDGIVLFRPLDQAAIKQVAGLMLKQVAHDLAEKGIELKVTDEAMEYFAGIGFDPEFGARPMRRVIQERVENMLAELLLSQKIKRRDVVTIGAEGKVEIQ